MVKFGCSIGKVTLRMLVKFESQGLPMASFHPRKINHLLILLVLSRE